MTAAREWDTGQMTTRGTVRFWLDGDGWGVIDSAETPGGCWTHFSHVRSAGYRSLAVGQEVELEWEADGQDGYPFRAVRTWAAGQEPIEPTITSGGPDAYRSTLTINWDSEDPDSGGFAEPPAPSKGGRADVGEPCQ